MIVCGCHQGPPTQFVEGIVTLDGNVLNDVSVSFVPKTKDQAPGDPNDRPLIASGLTDEKGRYRLSAIMGGKAGGGTTVGEYNVSITKKEMTHAPDIEKSMGGKNRPKYRDIVPEKFGNSKTSGITATVVKGRNRFDFDLRSDGSFEVKK